jgi:uncharacterized protein (TIGR02217 family)
MIATELDLCPSYGWQGGPEFATRIVTLKNGHERRNANWAQMRHHYTLPFANITDANYLSELKSVFLVVQGMAGSFLAKDHSDYQATNESLGNAPSGSTAVQLQKTYTFGASSFVRTITKPTSVAVKQAGVAKSGTYSATTGLFTPSTAWTEGEALTWTGTFLVPVRFASDLLQMSIDARNSDGAFLNGSVELVEVFGE